MDSRILTHPSLVCAQDLSDICAPLLQLNISYFAHVRIDHQKRFSALSTNPDFALHYLKNKFYTKDIHMIDDNKIGHFFIWDGVEFTDESARMCRDANEFGIYNPFTIIERNKETVDYFHFGSHVPNRQVNQTYVANLDLLKLFISYFKENIRQSKSLAKAYTMTFDVYAVPPTSFEDDTMIYKRDEFLQQLDLKQCYPRLDIDNIILSKRQTEIIRLVVLGKTRKEIGRILNLSERTVGHYFEAVKNKLRVKTRSEVIEKVMDAK